MKVAIGTAQNKAVLHHQSRDPQVIGQDVHSLLTQLEKELGIMVGRLSL